MIKIQARSTQIKVCSIHKNYQHQICSSRPLCHL